MKDKSVAMPCESRGAARAWLIKHVTDAQAIKARRCIVFPQRRSLLQSTISSQANDTRCYELTILFARPWGEISREAGKRGPLDDADFAFVSYEGAAVLTPLPERILLMDLELTPLKDDDCDLRRSQKAQSQLNSFSPPQTTRPTTPDANMLKVTSSRKGCAVGGKSRPSSKEVTAPSGLIAVFEYDCDETSDRRQAPTSMLAMSSSPGQQADAERIKPVKSPLLIALQLMIEFWRRNNRQIC